MADVELFGRRLILGHVEAVLHQAGAAGAVPTPLDQVAVAAGAREVIDIGELPEDLISKKPKAWRRILGAYLFRSETVFIDGSQPEGRQRFIKAHELGHRILPWQRDAFYLDNDARLFRHAEEQFEAEANLAAAFLLFQGRRFHERALDFEDSLKTPLLLASEYAASLHATFRFYAEHHPEAVALIVAGYLARQDGTVPVWTTVESPAFAVRFGPLSAWFPDRALRVLGDDASPLGTLAWDARRTGELTEKLVRLTDLAGSKAVCKAEAFSNQHCLFVFVSPHRLVRTGRQVRFKAG
ncbi:MAG: ImmA/IrrE family metallo-endopeptidase [Actinomycetota bacterium]|nr:ImmA/IrrE family metallo-endopeptidase [Actinomycetota bacterium]MDQ6945083.1 ImmA/IrrE family metallo-endopeptidase [Actinomycetota bacterium]